MRTPQSRVRVPRRTVACVVLLTLAAACGSSSDDGDDASSPTTEIGQGNTQQTPCRAGFDVEAPPDDGEPQTGGTLRYGIEAETDGWNATSNRWAISGQIVANTFFDTLTTVAADGTFVPNLAESVEPNDDYTVWTITVRDGIAFHDGTPLDAVVVKQNLDAMRSATLTQPALANIASVEVTDDLSVEVAMEEPWVPFPQYLASQVGVMMAPAMFDDPSSNSHPIGTGPFVFQEWIPDSQLTVVRNDDYWRTDEEGRSLPYLDSIEFVPLPDPAARKQAFDAGDIDVMHTYSTDQIEDFRQRADDGDANAYESCAWGENEEFFLMFNNGKPPFDDIVAREAVARAIDRDEIMANIFGGTYQAATGPWAPGSQWYSPPPGGRDTVYDPDRARELAQQYEEEHGEPLQFTIGAPGSIQEAATAQQLIKSYLEEVGIEVQLETIDYATYLVNAITGDYEANIWRQYDAPDPDGEYVWWHPDNVRPIGELSLNIARFADEEMGAALDRGRQSDDPEERREAYAEVQRIFREQYYLGWSAHAFWSVATQPEVHDLVDWTSPDGAQGMPLTGGRHPLTQVWLNS